MSERVISICDHCVYKACSRRFSYASAYYYSLGVTALFAPELIGLYARKRILDRDHLVIVREQVVFYTLGTENRKSAFFQRLRDDAIVLIPSGADHNVSRSYIFRLRQYSSADGAARYGARNGCVDYLCKFGKCELFSAIAMCTEQ